MAEALVDAQRTDFRATKLAFFEIMRRWGVSDGDARVLLGHPSRSTLYDYKKGEGGKPSPDTLERISYVLGAFKALRLIYNDDRDAEAWMRRPNADFDGRSPLEHALLGRVVDLAEVRAYLDGVRGGGG